MQSSTPLEDSKLFIPEDVKLANPADGSATGQYNRVPASFLKLILQSLDAGHVLCHKEFETHLIRNVHHVPQYQYQLETREDIQLNLNEAGKEFYKTPIFLGNLKLYLGTSCKN
jgi:hypothetical protein